MSEASGQGIKRVVENLAIVAVVVIGGYLAMIGLGELRVARASTGWPTVTGEVLETRIVKKSGRHTTARVPIVSYEYEVDGQRFTSERLRAYQWGGSSSFAQNTVDQYPPGSTHSVSYDPADPRSAVLIPGATWHVHARTAGGLGAALIGVVLLGSRLRRSA